MIERDSPMKPWMLILAGVLIGLLATGAILLISQPERGVPITLSPPPTPTHTPLPKPTATSVPIQVLIKGEIVNPGTYTMDRETRLSDLIELAGGLTEKADAVRVNDAFLLRDGDYFYIPLAGESIPETARNAPGNNPLDNPAYFDYPLDLNTASKEALESLPGIGPAKATDIVDYREQHGPFESIDELLNVPGIGPTIFESIREYLTIGN
ncbi:MAG TPA: helix-hairpin-helix domain-containing protein [Brevefilum sp.]|nr:helix-hairpin-helix domain-containing protein [Brevefilum sp.]